MMCNTLVSTLWGFLTGSAIIYGSAMVIRGFTNDEPVRALVGLLCFAFGAASLIVFLSLQV